MPSSVRAGAGSRVAAVTLDRDIAFGRSPDVAGVVLDHPTVSKLHARVSRVNGGGFEIKDLQSTNGTFVNGTRLAGSKVLAQGDQLRIGPFAFVVQGQMLAPLQAALDGELRTHSLTFRAKAEGQLRTLLNEVSVAIKPGEFVAIIGPSGCGKSTLIRMLGGRSSPTSGSVSWNDVDLHRHFATIKQEIAFVPQREVLPDLLTVRSCLTYTARMRLPADTSAAEIDNLVRATVGRVALADQVDLPITRLSGGQRKRASLANELLVRPRVLLLDEVTSGLDESTDYEVMELCRGLAVENGIAIVCVTHTLANVAAWCDSLLVMAKGGNVAYHGPVAQATSHFNVKHLSEIYQKLGKPNTENWGALHASKSPYYERVRNSSASDANGASAASKTPTRAAEQKVSLSQLNVLVERYLDIVRADKATLLMAAIQSIVIGAVLRIMFGGNKPVPPAEYQLVFLLGVSAFWFGTNNAAKEIIKENPLFSIERDVNLRIVSYVLSKVAVLSALGLIEVALLFAIVRLLGLTFAHPGPILAIMLLALVTGTGCGLMISAASKSEDLAVSLVPIALIPQILLSNAIAPLPEFAESVAKAIIPVYWAYRAQLQVLGAPGISGHSAWVPLLGLAVAFVIVAMLALWNRDRIRRT